MEYARSESVVPRLVVLAEAASTNDELVRRATGEDALAWPELSTVVTDNQTAGRGRLGRTWVTPPGAALAVSVLLRPAEAVPIERYGWFPLLAGLAAARAVRASLPGGEGGERVMLKWPNDVLIEGKKVCGILSELLPGASGVVVGAGLNLTQSAAELPVETATSLRLAGGTPDPDAVLAGYLREFAALYTAFTAAGGDPMASGLYTAVTEACGTIGAPVRVHLPSSAAAPDIRTGTATGLDPLGRLIVEGNGPALTVAAGDVTHLRY